MNDNASVLVFAFTIFAIIVTLFLLPSVFGLYATRQPWRFEEWCLGVYGKERCERERHLLRWEFSEFQ
ncbi:hypothetical protein C4552_02270 [Candidatus Parcubacteria bacterium]|nr:MAG: hypothetical protein C4552_02270 [Candidatus Parcubacteria bacterium]